MYHSLSTKVNIVSRYSQIFICSRALLPEAKDDTRFLLIDFQIEMGDNGHTVFQTGKLAV